MNSIGHAILNGNTDPKGLATAIVLLVLVVVVLAVLAVLVRRTVKKMKAKRDAAQAAGEGGAAAEANHAISSESKSVEMGAKPSQGDVEQAVSPV